MSIQRKISLNHTYLHIPVRKDAQGNYVKLIVGGECRHEFRIELDDQASDFYAFIDVSKYKGNELVVRVENPQGITEAALDRFMVSDENCNKDNELYQGLYSEKFRPQYHFTSRRGWLNDPNGLVYQNGLFHMFYQHNPFGIRHGGVNISWGHTVSEDLIHWREQSDALHPVSKQAHIASGGAVVDHDNTAGFGKEAMILSYTSLASANFTEPGASKFPTEGQFLAYSLDNGVTFQTYEGNPILPGVEEWRDPRIVWYEPQKKWVLTVYEEHYHEHCVAFYESTDLKQWKLLSILAGLYECPDFFELNVKNEPGHSKWVLYGAEGRYMIGDFDGKVFKAIEESDDYLDYGDIFYAAQTWSNTENAMEYALNIAWIRSENIGHASEVFPEMPFNQQMTITTKLDLVNTENGYRILRYPIEGIKTLRDQETIETTPLNPGTAWKQALGGSSDMEISFAIQNDTIIEFSIANSNLIYDSSTGHLDFGNGKKAYVTPSHLELRVLMDVVSVELFFNEGEASSTYHLLDNQTDLAISIREGSAEVTVKKWLMKSIW
ncbi:hypothetical protein A8709_13190 [Paenibacillus pectinilyticus]|uniref:2,6-beta-D-fructofuranosidase n=1 Tax=Paenibacillus pectinilyticus TaxID=512399 RepID=A0A1C1A3D5_9BACL|nr:glycoside hydrolase family 32 protein [Paenibacillus pectinilyticus]OCT15065.1 hypothetical protein A8709_13190 [Paenibacillus pectinilyticus]